MLIGMQINPKLFYNYPKYNLFLIKTIIYIQFINLNLRCSLFNYMSAIKECNMPFRFAKVLYINFLVFADLTCFMFCHSYICIFDMHFLIIIFWSS
jgi:hypothetical protein